MYFSERNWLYLYKVQKSFYLIYSTFTVQYTILGEWLSNWLYDSKKFLWNFSNGIWICRVKIHQFVLCKCFISVYSGLGTCCKTRKQNLTKYKLYLCSYIPNCLANILYLLLWHFPSQIVYFLPPFLENALNLITLVL